MSGPAEVLTDVHTKELEEDNPLHLWPQKWGCDLFPDISWRNSAWPHSHGSSEAFGVCQKAHNPVTDRSVESQDPELLGDLHIACGVESWAVVNKQHPHIQYVSYPRRDRAGCSAETVSSLNLLQIERSQEERHRGASWLAMQITSDDRGHHVGAMACCRESLKMEVTTSASCLVGLSWNASWPHRPTWVQTQGLSMTECVHQGCHLWRSSGCLARRCVGFDRYANNISSADIENVLLIPMSWCYSQYIHIWFSQ